MNRIAIYNLLALFFISFAPAQAEKLDEVYAIKDAQVIDRFANFKKKDVFLYRTSHIYKDESFYKVGHESGQLSDKFLIGQHCTFVSKDGLLTEYAVKEITLTADDNFALYRELFSLADFDFPRTFGATSLTHGSKQWKISAIKAKQGSIVDRVWIFAAVDGNTPHFVFPVNRTASLSHQESDTKVSFTLKVFNDSRIPTIINFATSADADNFYQLVKNNCPCRK